MSRHASAFTSGLIEAERTAEERAVWAHRTRAGRGPKKELSNASRRGRRRRRAYLSERSLRRRVLSTNIPPTAMANAAMAMSPEISAPVKANGADGVTEATVAAAPRVTVVVATLAPSVAVMVQVPAAPAGMVTVVLMVPVADATVETGVIPQPVSTTVLPGSKFEPVTGSEQPAVEHAPPPAPVPIVGKFGPYAKAAPEIPKITLREISPPANTFEAQSLILSLLLSLANATDTPSESPRYLSIGGPLSSLSAP
jgi:hypothetical protein